MWRATKNFVFLLNPWHGIGHTVRNISVCHMTWGRSHGTSLFCLSHGMGRALKTLQFCMFHDMGRATKKLVIVSPMTWEGPQIIFYYSTGVQIVSCTLSSDSVLSDSTGLFNLVLCVSQWNIFWQKKNNQSDCVFQLKLGMEEHYSSSPLADFNRLFEGQIGTLFKIWHLDMIYF